jgi:hypothetical protein
MDEVLGQWCLNLGKFVCGTLLVHGLVWKTLFDMSLSVRHCNFMFWSMGHCAVSIR